MSMSAGAHVDSRKRGSEEASHSHRVTMSLASSSSVDAKTSKCHHFQPVASEQTLVFLGTEPWPGTCLELCESSINPRFPGLAAAEWSPVPWGRTQGVAVP